jgi:excinuclease ABC subunit C
MRFIEGRGEDVLADLVARMERSSETLEYESAARYRDQIAEVRRVQEQQVIAAGTADLDGVAVAQHKGQVCVAVLMIRGGRVLGTRCFFPRAAAGTSAGEILSAFLVQHYLVQPAPPEILVDGAVEDADLLGATLAAHAGHPVAVRQRVRGRRRRWLEMTRENAQQGAASRAAATATFAAQLQDVADALGLAAPPERIECFDISHTQGGETVASCVVFGPAGPVKSDYRRFNIRAVAAGDDYGALAEAVGRRYAKAGTAGTSLPDLLLIDGGRGQLARVRDVLDELGCADVPTFAVAKGEGRRPGHERLFRPADPRPIDLAPDSLALHLIQHVRDEAHRFAITGHRQRRGRRQVSSSLEAIAGLGPRRRRALLQQFGGLQGIARAGVEDLARTPGISRALAERIYGRFHEAGPADDGA